MTNPDYTHIALIVDRSGSMVTIKSDMEGGLNTFLEDQAKIPGKCLVDLHIFDTEYETVYENRSVGSAKVQIVPRGGTALLDAIGKTVVSLGEKLSRMDGDKRPEIVIVAIITDGEENSSREWELDEVKKLIEMQQSEWSWKFVFLGANMDAIAAGSGMGLAKGMSMGYTASAAGTRIGTQSLSNYTTSVRSGKKDAKLDEDSA